MKIAMLKRLFQPCKFIASRTLATNAAYQKGQQVHGYEIKRVADISEFSMTAIELEHLKTGCKHLHLIRDDSNNVFNVSLRTTPMNSTGVAHVLEHVALCGSEKFSVRDPFFKMLDRSMSTFMNALTGPDYTMYPFSTQNPKDFKNLMSVYLDSVFFPQIRKLDFLQEGWRLEHENNEDPTSPITFKGVVFNEMKGMLADASYLFGTALMNQLLPDHTYGVCSGGKPDKILDLTWEDLKNFHAGHYHPSNASFITYGDMPMENHLQQINKALQRFEKINPGTEVPLQTKWSGPKSSSITCPPDELAANPEKQTTFAVSYLLPESSNIQETFIASIICNLLIDGPASPLYKSLIESGLGSGYSPQSGYHSHQKEAIFSVGLQGISPDDVNKVKGLIEKTLDEVSRDGFPRDRVDAILHRIELQQKHQSSQFGLGLSFNVMPTWQHGADPITSLKVDSMVTSFRKQMDEDPEFLQKKCVQYFTANQHRHCLMMSPDPKYSESLDGAEREKLKCRVGKLSVDDKDHVYEQGLELSREQQTPSDVTCLPTLHVTDIPRIQQNYEVMLHQKSDQPLVVTCSQPTNGITYFDAMFPVNELNEDLKPYLPLFCEVLTQMGTQNTDYVTFSQREDKCSGGLSASVMSHGSHSDAMTSETAVRLHSHCLDRNMDAMLELWREIFSQVTFEDSVRLQTLIRQSAQELTNSVSYNGHVFAMRSAAQYLSPSAAYTERFNGLTQVNFMKEIAESQNVDDVINKLRQIASYALCRSGARFALHSTSDFMTQAMTSLDGLIADIPAETQQMFKSDFVTKGVLTSLQDNKIQSLVRWNNFEADINPLTRVHQELSLPVNFVSMGVRTVAPYSHADAPTLRVLARLMTTKFLHREIREMGGAYGGGARYDGDGVFRFYSYRDPNNIRTVSRFLDSVTWAREGKFESRDIDEAKLAVFQTIDSPVSPSGRGRNIFISGLDDVTRQQHRDLLLGVDKEQLISAANEYLDESRDTSVVVIGPSDEKTREYGMTQKASSVRIG
uniref:Presequence protease, mitochondrial n=1 Tax=Phallusia mammillata TaxID=59560 RepID=A0A6F9DN97_9ASCI|nr:presequence protease, mitochondrial-like [Phallusia mammillata]